MKQGLAVAAITFACACGGGGGAGRANDGAGPSGGGAEPFATYATYACFRAEVPATATRPAGPRGLCMRSLDDCRIARRTFLDALASELGAKAAVGATECEARDRAHCAVAEPAGKAAYNACGPDLAICNWVKGNLERGGGAKVGACKEFPGSRLDLLAVEPIDFRMWCFRDDLSAGGADCQSSLLACESMVQGLAAKGVVKPRAWPDGSLCAAQEKVVCYRQLHRTQERIKLICTPTFDECQARSADVRGADFEVVGSCGLVTGNKPWS